MASIRRRDVLSMTVLGVTGLAGCIGSDEDQNSDSTTGNMENEVDEECTRASISGFKWENNMFSEDSFSGTVINRGDVAGEVVVTVTFYEDESKRTRTGQTSRRVSISAQESKDIELRANPPTDDSNWATMSVSEQDCRRF